jgi:hypothetical protein
MPPPPASSRASAPPITRGASEACKPSTAVAIRIPVLCEALEVQIRITKAVSDAIEAVWFHRWHPFEIAARNMKCALIIIPRLNVTPNVDRLAELIRTHPSAPTLLLTETDFLNTRELRRLPVTDVLPIDCTPRLLLDTISMLVKDAPFARIDNRVREATHLPTIVRLAFLHMWTGSPFPRTVERLTRDAGTSKRTFYSHWHAAFNGAPPYDPKLMLDWVLTLRSLRLRSSGYVWKQVESELAVHRASIMRAASRAVGGQPSVSEVAVNLLLTRFESEVLGPLLSGGRG